MADYQTVKVEPVSQREDGRYTPALLNASDAAVKAIEMFQEMANSLADPLFREFAKDLQGEINVFPRTSTLVNGQTHLRENAKIDLFPTSPDFNVALGVLIHEMVHRRAVRQPSTAVDGYRVILDTANKVFPGIPGIFNNSYKQQNAYVAGADKMAEELGISYSAGELQARILPAMLRGSHTVDDKTLKFIEAFPAVANNVLRWSFGAENNLHDPFKLYPRESLSEFISRVRPSPGDVPDAAISKLPPWVQKRIDDMNAKERVKSKTTDGDSK